MFGGVYGAGDGEIDCAHNCAYAEGKLVVCDRNNSRYHIYDTATTERLETWPCDPGTFEQSRRQFAVPLRTANYSRVSHSDASMRRLQTCWFQRPSRGSRATRATTPATHGRCDLANVHPRERERERRRRRASERARDEARDRDERPRQRESGAGREKAKMKGAAGALGSGDAAALRPRGLAPPPRDSRP